MRNGTFMDIIGIHYDEIKNLYRSRDKNRERSFCEDSFNDAFIKCSQKFGNTLITYEDAIKYFWIAYENTHKCNKKKNSKLEYCEDIFMDEIIDDDEKNFASNIYDLVMDAVSAAYSEEDMMIYSLYKYHNWTKKELIEAGYDCSNLELRIKNIYKFVKEYCKKNIKMS